MPLVEKPSNLSHFLSKINRIWVRLLGSEYFMKLCGEDPLLETEVETKLKFYPRIPFDLNTKVRHNLQ